jgi:uncharacterized delta-60 repeat protein
MLLRAGLAAAGLLLLTACPAGDDAVGDGGTGDPSTTADATSTDDGSSTAVADESSTGGAPVCGNGMVEAGEQCDDGEANADTAACTRACATAVCGDGLVHEGAEACDDGNAVDDDACSNACLLPAICGDGMIQAPEECDDGRANADDGACKPDCTAAFCGDGEVQGGAEECDDADEDNEDECTQLCAPPTCGDGFAQLVNSELCDDGDDLEGDECNADCTTAGLWTDTYNGADDNVDEIHGVAFDAAGNVVVAGETFVSGQGDDIWVRKYSHAGDVMWTETFHGVTADVGWAVTVAADDDVLVGGSSFTLDDGRDAWVRRYSPDGVTEWTQTFDGTSHEDDEVRGIAVDPAGNVLVAGYVTTAAAQRDIWVRKYSAAGVIQWTRTAAGTDGQDDEGRGIAADADGNVLVVGYVWAGEPGQRDVWVRKYDPDGDELWTRTHDGPQATNDEGNGIATDAAGNVIAVGFQSVPDVGRDIWVRKYDPDGGELWTSTYDAPQNGYDAAHGVAVSLSGEIVVGGSIFRGPQSDNVWVRKHDPDGNELWTSTYNSDGFGSDGANAVAVDPAGNVAAGGFETRTDLGEFSNTWLRYFLQ